MAKLTDLPNELILEIFRNRDTELRASYMAEFWSLPYLDPGFWPLCLEENARLDLQRQDADSETLNLQAEKIEAFKVKEADWVAHKFMSKIACRQFKKPFSMLLAELRDVSLEEEGIHRDADVLGRAARLMVLRQMTRNPLLRSGEVCCKSKSDPLSLTWHMKEQLKHYMLQQKVLWTWWWLEKKENITERIESWIPALSDRSVR